MKKLLWLMLLATTMTQAQSFDFSCTTFTEVDGAWSMSGCDESYSLEYTTIANKNVWQVTYSNENQNNYLASTEEKAHSVAQTKIKLLCEE